MRDQIITYNCSKNFWYLVSYRTNFSFTVTDVSNTEVIEVTLYSAEHEFT